MKNAAILIVEDERILARDLEVTLQRAGYDIAGLATSGEEAIRLAGQLRPDFIIMDVVLEGDLDGFEAASQIKANLDIPVLFMSSFRDAGLLERAKQVEAVGYMLKPWTEADMLATIDVAIHRCRSSQHRSQKVLEASELRFRKLFYANGQGIALVDRAGRIMDANPALSKMLDYDMAQLKNLWLSDVVHADDFASEDGLLKELFAGTRETYRVEQHNRGRNGGLLKVRAEAWMLPGNGSPDGVPLAVRTVVDISEQALMQQRLATAQRLETVGQMAMGFAHNLGNDLTPALVGLPLLRENIQRQDRLEMLATMETGLQRGANLIRQILRSGRHSSREKSALDCKEMIEEVAAMARQIFAKGIRVTTDIGSELRPVWANPDEIHQCLLNLCVNARDAMPKGGELRLTVRNEVVAEGDPKFSSRVRPGHYVLLAASDTGVGVSPENLSRICEPFFTTKPAGQGSGLGLSMTLEMVKNHGGHLILQSRPGEGTEVDILLPADESGRAAAGPKDAQASVGNRDNYCILLRQ